MYVFTELSSVCLQLMAMMSDLFSKFEDLRSIVEKAAESLEKTSDSTSSLVSVCRLRFIVHRSVYSPPKSLEQVISHLRVNEVYLFPAD